MNNNTSETSTICFTVLPSNAGFTDQLLQFSVFYKLGQSLGYRYLHSTFSSKREGSEHIYDFLGFNAHFEPARLTHREALYRLMGQNNTLQTRKRSASLKNRVRELVKKIKFRVISRLFFPTYNFIDIGVHDDTPHDEKLGAILDFQNLVRNIVAGNRDKRRVNVVRLYPVAGIYFFRKLAPSVNQQMPFFPDNLNLRSTHLRLAGNNLGNSVFSPDKLKLLLHIRLGDTAYVETPWHTYIPLWAGNDIRPLKEFPDTSDRVFQNVMDTTDFVGFMNRLARQIDMQKTSIAIFSDGYRKTFQEITRLAAPLSLDKEKLAALTRLSETYEERRFSGFDSLENATRIVGENNRDLQELIHASMLADVIIVGCNQRMLPKFLSTYYHAAGETPTIIIALYKGDKPDYEEKLGLSAQKAAVYPVNINDIDKDSRALEEAAAALRQRISQLS